MPRRFLDSPGRLRALVLGLCLCALAGCGSSSPLEEAGVSGLEPPASWRAVDPGKMAVPGLPLAAWEGPDGAVLVVFRSLPAPEPKAKAVAEELANRLRNAEGVTVESVRTEKVGGVEAGRVEAKTRGTGGVLAPAGPVEAGAAETHRLAVAVPLRRATVWLVWRFPESGRQAVLPAVESALRSLVIRDRG